MLATIVDGAALWRVTASSFVVSVAVTTLFTSGLILVEPGDRPPSAARRALGGLLLLASFALVAGGLYVVFTTT
jgi:hypothetical protein